MSKPSESNGKEGKLTIDSVPTLKGKCLFGLNSEIKRNLTFLDDHRVVHIAGTVLVIDTVIEQNVTTQQFITLPKSKRKINTLDFTLDRKCVAIGETGDKAAVCVIDLVTGERLKYLGNPFKNHTSKIFEIIRFSTSGKYLYVVVGAPEWEMLFYNWKKGKVESKVVANLPPANVSPILDLAPNPRNDNIIAVVGHGIFRLLEQSESVWKQFGFNRASNLPLTCVMWLTDKRLVAGTSDGRLTIIEDGILVGVFSTESKEIHYWRPELEEDEGEGESNDEGKSKASVDSQDHKSLTKSDDVKPKEIIKDPPTPEGPPVQSLYPLPEGFVYILGKKTIEIFLSAPVNRYVKYKITTLPEPELGSRRLPHLDTITHLTVNIPSTILMVTTARSELYSVSISKDLEIEGNEVQEDKFTLFQSGNHHGPIGFLSTCVWKPLFVTYGSQDHTIRIWNYVLCRQLLVYDAPDEVHSTALHPFGLYMLINFIDKVQFCLITSGTIKTIREFNASGVELASFSSSGHMFACGSESSISIYRTINQQLVYSLQGHIGQITALIWTNDDETLWTCGTEGSIYEWNMQNGKRVGEIYTKHCSHNDITVSKDGKTCYSIGSDRKIKEIKANEVVKEIDLSHIDSLNCISLAYSNQMMFLGCSDGIVLSVMYPFVHPPLYRSFRVQIAPVTKIRISPDDLHLITATVDGTVCIWSIENCEGRHESMNEQDNYVNEVLIGVEELKEKYNTIRDLRARVQEMENEHLYIVQQMQQSHDTYVEHLDRTYVESIGEQKEKLAHMDQNYAMEINNIQVEMKRLKEAHSSELSEKEISSARKLRFEYEKYEKLMKLYEKDKEHYTELIEKQTQEAQTSLKKLENDKNIIIKSREDHIKRMKLEVKEMVKEYEELKTQMEYESEKELAKIRAEFELTIKENLKNIYELKSENSILMKRNARHERAMKNHEDIQSKMKEEISELKNVVNQLMKEISVLTGNLQERDKIMSKKDALLKDIARLNMGYEKDKILRDIRLDTMRKQLQPKDAKIDELSHIIKELSNELKGIKTKHQRLEQNYKLLQRRFILQKNLYHKQQARTTDVMNMLLKKTENIIKSGNAFSQDELVKKVKAIFEKYVTHTETLEPTAQAPKDFEIQRKQSVIVLKAGPLFTPQPTKPTKMSRKKISSLIEEVKDLRNKLYNQQLITKKLLALNRVSREDLTVDDKSDEIVE